MWLCKHFIVSENDESEETFRSSDDRENVLLSAIRLLSCHFSLAEANSHFRQSLLHSTSSSTTSSTITGSPPIPIDVKTNLETTLYRYLLFHFNQDCLLNSILLRWACLIFTFNCVPNHCHFDFFTLSQNWNGVVNIVFEKTSFNLRNFSFKPLSISQPCFICFA